jgi:hypothetical protein
MVNPKSYDTNRILRDIAKIRGTVGSINTVPPWITIPLDPTWATLTGYAPPSYRLWQDGVHLEFTGIADFGSAATGSHNLNANNPLPIAPLTTKTISPVSGIYNIGNRGFVQIYNTGVIEMICSSSFTAEYAEINAIISIDL